MITGGGGAVLAPYITPLLNGRVLPIDGSRAARLNNARGFWKLGVQNWGAPAPATAEPEPALVGAADNGEAPRELPY